jgi:hypothetical protein
MKKVNKWYSIIEVGDEVGFCYIQEHNGIGRVDFGKILEIDKENKCFTVYSNWYKKPIAGVTAIRGCEIDKSQWEV